VIQIHITQLYILRFRSGSLTCIASKYDDIQKRVAHQTVSSMNTADSLSCYKQVVDYFCKSVSADLKSAVLVVQCRVYKNRKFSHIDIIFHVHTEHRRDPFLDRSRSADHLDHRSIKPYAASKRCVHALAARCTLADNA